jgi:hypothetical protein
MCLNPIRATFTYTVNKKTGMPERDPGRPTFDPEGELKIPCGKCDECISRRAIEWSMRAKHEISLHEENCFITLTYDDNSRPKEILKSDFQKFLKRLRKKYHLHNKIRYMVSYEYGTKNNNFHMHAILFGFDFKKQKLLNKNNGNPLYTSEDLGALWTHGYHSIGQANEKTAYYIASYALKGNNKEVVDPESGEINQFTDCMDVSKRPAIGLRYFVKNAEQIVNTGNIPRYYEKKLADPEWCLEKFPEYAKQIGKFPLLLEQLEESKYNNFKERSDHEIYAKFVINSQKSDSSNTAYRASSGSSKKCNKLFQERLTFGKHLKMNRDNFVSGNQRKKHD